jgi:hypothetical protein
VITRTSTPNPHCILDRSAPRRRRLARAGIAVGLTAAVALTGACRRNQSGSGLSKELQAWHKDYRSAVNDMSEAAGGGKDLKQACQDALDALKSHESKLVNAPDQQLSELAQGFVDERSEAYQKCAETGVAPEGSRKTVEMERRLRELGEAGTNKK